MSDKTPALLNSKLPAHLQSLGGDDDADEWASGTASGFPVVSTRGKVFHVKRGDDVELIAKADDPDEPETKLKVVVLKTNKGVSRTYYEDTYEEGSDDPPTCYSNDGIIPAADVEDRQAKKCAVCPKAQWGSRITESGKKGKACSEVKRLAVALWSDPSEPMLLRVPPTSLKGWDTYVNMLFKRGVKPPQVITEIRFDPSVSHQVLMFKPIGFVTEDMLEDVQSALAEPTVEQIIGAGNDPGDITPPADDEDEDEAPPKPKKKAPPKRRAPAKASDEEDDEEEAPPKPKKKAPARRRKPAPEPEDSDEDDEEDEAPPPKKAPARKKAAPATEPEDSAEGDDDEDDPLGSLDLDDLDFSDDDEDEDED
jgi:hypothetical protein